MGLGVAILAQVMPSGPTGNLSDGVRYALHLPAVAGDSSAMQINAMQVPVMAITSNHIMTIIACVLAAAGFHSLCVLHSPMPWIISFWRLLLQSRRGSVV